MPGWIYSFPLAEVGNVVGTNRWNIVYHCRPNHLLMATINCRPEACTPYSTAIKANKYLIGFSIKSQVFTSLFTQWCFQQHILCTSWNFVKYCLYSKNPKNNSYSLKKEGLLCDLSIYICSFSRHVCPKQLTNEENKIRKWARVEVKCRKRKKKTFCWSKSLGLRPRPILDIWGTI